MKIIEDTGEIFEVVGWVRFEKIDNRWYAVFATAEKSRLIIAVKHIKEIQA